MKNEINESYVYVQKLAFTIFSWLFVLFLFLLGVGLFTVNILVGLLAVTIAVTFIPFVKEKLQARVKRLGILQGVAVLALFIAMGVIAPSASESVEQVVSDTSEQNEETENVDLVVLEEQTVPDEPETVNEQPNTVVPESAQTQEQAQPDVMTRLWIAVDDAFQTRDTYNVQWLSEDPKDTVAILIKSPDDYWNENEIVRQAYRALVKYGKQVFKNPEVTSVGVVIQGNFTDTYGNSTTNEAVRIIMPRTEFEKFNWENLMGRPVSTQIENASEIYMIHPGVRQGINPDKLYLSY